MFTAKMTVCESLAFMSLALESSLTGFNDCTVFWKDVVLQGPIVRTETVIQGAQVAGNCKGGVALPLPDTIMGGISVLSTLRAFDLGTGALVFSVM